jgi:enhancing lycopene biosynthesis protein 2
MEKQAKIAVILSGSGVFDGSEIHEATLTLYYIMKNNATYQIFAPDIPQHHVINHITGEEMQEGRNVLVESARIARGDIKNLTELKAADFDGMILPGGFGAAKNLSDFAFKSEGCEVNKDVANAIREMVDAGKPMGALCISPVIIAKVLGDVKLTIGQDETTANAIVNMGALHEKTSHGEIIVDEKYKIVTTPCYMLDANILQIGEGANNVVKEVIKMA